MFRVKGNDLVVRDLLKLLSKAASLELSVLAQNVIPSMQKSEEDSCSITRTTSSC